MAVKNNNNNGMEEVKNTTIPSLKSGLPALARCIAGPGSGKTECLCQNVLFLVGRMVEMGYDPVEAFRSFLLITFTDAAAIEIAARCALRAATQGIIVNGEPQKVAITSDDIHASTFNGFCYEIDKKYWKELGYAKELSVIQGANADRGQLVQDCLQDHPVGGLNYQNPTAKGGAIEFCEKCFDYIKVYMDLDDTSDHADELRMAMCDNRSRIGKKDPDWNGIIDLYIYYNDKLKDKGLMEFPDQEPAALKLIDAHPEIIGDSGIRHIIVDEFQDSSPLQMELVKRFAADESVDSILVIGDDFQSIYGFRDADPENMIDFFGRIGRDGQTLLLTDNYRSTPEIVEMGNRTIARNVNKVDKTIVATRPSGDPVEIKAFYRNKTELRYIASRIMVLVNRDGVAPEDIAFISYRRQTVREMAAILQEFGVPVVVKVPTGVADDPNVKAVEALSRAVESPDATELYLEFLVAKYNGHLYENGRTKEDIEEEISQMSKTFKNLALKEFGAQRHIFHTYVDMLETRDEIFSYFKDSCYRQPDFVEEIAYIDRFVHFGQNEEIKMSQEYAGVTLTTAHSSKGLEWPYVFATISDYDNEVINRKKSDNAEVEEIRRLEFVAFTRAKDHLFVSGTYKAWDKPKKDDSGKTVGRNVGYNRFLKEILEDNGINYVPDDPTEALREKHAAEVRKENARKAMEKRKANAERKEKLKLARLEAKEKAGRILTLYERHDLTRLRNKYDPSQNSGKD